MQLPSRLDPFWKGGHRKRQEGGGAPQRGSCVVAVTNKVHVTIWLLIVNYAMFFKIEDSYIPTITGGYQ